MAQGYDVNINLNVNNSSQGGALPPPSPNGYNPNNGGSQSNYLNSVLKQLQTSIDKLNVTLNTLALNPGTKPVDPTPNSPDEQKKKNDVVSSMLKAGAIGTIVSTAFRWMNANSNALMSQATARGNFASAGILGGANQNFAGYVGSFWDIERQRRIAKANAVGQGAGTLVGGALGSLGGVGGAVAGGAAGASIGSYATAFLSNANTEQGLLAVKGYYERAAMASNSEYREGFSRFGMGSNPFSLGTNGVSSIDAHLSNAFENKYGQLNGNENPYYNDIQNIVPYLQSSPLDQKTGDLNQFIQNLQKAGIATSEYTKVTTQGIQYQALTGRQQIDIANVLYNARKKYGDAFGVTEMQTSLNLMSQGYSQSQAQNIAYQSISNPGVLSSSQQYMNQSVPDYYRNKALSKTLGFDINKSLMMGHMVGADSQTISEYKKELEAVRNGGEPGRLLTIANAAGGLPSGRISELMQPLAATLANPGDSRGGLTDAQNEAIKDVTQGIKDALNNVGDIFMTATNVTINTQQPMTEAQRLTKQAGSAWVPFRNAVENYVGDMLPSNAAKSAYSWLGGHLATKK